MVTWKNREARGIASFFMFAEEVCGGCIHLNAEEERGMNDFSGFYHSGAWAQCRESYRRYRGGLCERCLKNGIVKAGVDVHHKVHLSIDNIHDPTVTLNWNNLELLCRECHAAEHSAKRFTVDALGRVTAK